MAGVASFEDPIEDNNLPQVIVNLHGTDEVTDMVYNSLPYLPPSLYVPENFPEWWSHPGLSKDIWHPPLVPHTWVPPQVLPEVWHPPLKWPWHPPLVWPDKIIDRIDVLYIHSKPF